MQFCSYFITYEPDTIWYDKTLIFLTTLIVGLVIPFVLSKEEHIAKIFSNLSSSAKITILRLYLASIVILPIILMHLFLPKYGILHIEYLDPDTPTAITQSEIVDKLCPLIEKDFFGYYFGYSYPWNGTNKRSKDLTLTKDEWLKIKASEDKIEKAAKEAKEKDKRGNLEIIK